MTPRVTLRRALHEPELLGTAFAGPSWHTWRSILLAAMGEPARRARSFSALHWSHDLNYEQNKSDIYCEILPLINSRAVALLENDRLVHQLISLERRTATGGRDRIDHARGGHDDLANAVAGALVTAVTGTLWSDEQRRRDSRLMEEAGRRFAQSIV